MLHISYIPSAPKYQSRRKLHIISETDGQTSKGGRGLTLQLLVLHPAGTARLQRKTVAASERRDFGLSAPARLPTVSFIFLVQLHIRPCRSLRAIRYNPLVTRTARFCTKKKKEEKESALPPRNSRSASRSSPDLESLREGLHIRNHRPRRTGRASLRAYYHR